MDEWLAWAEWRHQRDQAERELWWHAQAAWSHIRGIGPDSFDRALRGNVELIARSCFTDRGEASRLLALTVWYMVAVTPWRYLAQLGGLPLDDASFIAWAGRNDRSVREALLFLAAAGDERLAGLSSKWDWMRSGGPEVLLVSVAAAYAKVTVPKVIRIPVAAVLSEMARDHEITQRMTDMLMDLDPRAVDSVFGPDIAAQLDGELGLPPDTAGRVIRALAKRLGASAGGLDKVADRSVQKLPVTAVPDYRGAIGPGVLTARVVSGSLVGAGLAEPPDMTADEYVAKVRELWTPRMREADGRAA